MSINKFELDIPGLQGLNPDLLQAPQPLSVPGQWEAEVPGPCNEECCANTDDVIGLPEQVIFNNMC